MLLRISSPEEALDYLRRHADAVTFRKPGTETLRERVSAERLAGVYRRIGLQLARRQNRHEAIEIADSSSQHELAEKMRGRREKYRQKRLAAKR